MTDDRDRPPSGTERTLAAPASDPASDATLAAPASDPASDATLAAPGSNPRSAATVAEDTLAPASDVVRRAAGTTPSSRPGSGLRAKSDSQTRSIGEEMQAATIERFGRVGHDRFEMLDELARGGLGRVFRARDPRTNRIVAIKEVLRPQPDIIARFAREAMVTANLQHPAIVPVYEVGRWDTGEPFYAMKLVQGRTLDELIGEAPTLDVRMSLVPHLIDVADALAYAHGERVIHRDLKPANVLVGAYGETVVIDWGLAKNLATGEELDTLPLASTIPPDNAETVIGAVVGTPAYMPPEQAIGEKVDEHADVYAIGAILYHVLAGVRPYRQARTIEELLHLVSSQPPQPILELAPEAPLELVAIAEKAMARRPEDRYATAQGLAHDLRAFQAGKLVAAHRYTSWQLVRRWIAKHRGMVLTTAVALGVLITIGSVGVWRIARERDLAREQRAEAQAQRTLAEHRFAASLEELGRQALIARTPDKALPLLEGAATTRGGTSPSLDVLLGVAHTAYSGLVGIAPPHARGTTSAGLAHGGTWVVSAGTDGELRAWDLRANREVWHTTAARLIALSPDGSSILGIDGTGRLAIIAVATGKILHEWHLDAGTSTDVASVLAWAPDNTHFAVATPAGRVFLGAPTSSTLPSLDPHESEVWAVTFSADGALFATAGNDGTTMIREAATGKTRMQLVDGLDSKIASIAWLDPDRLITGDDKGIARLWSLGERRVVRRYTQTGDIYGVVLGGTAPRWLATFGNALTVTVWDVETGAVLARLGGHEVAVDIAAVVNGLLITADETGNTFVWDAVTGDRLQTLPSEGSVQGLTAAGDRVVVYGNTRLRIWQPRPDPGMRRLRGHTARVRELAWSKDGRVLWSASHDGTARGVDLATGTTTVLGAGGYAEPPLLTLPPAGTVLPVNPHGLRSLRVSPDGAYVATASEDGAIVLYEVANTAHQIRLEGHTGRARRVVFSRDQRSVYSVGDHTLRAWDSPTGTQRGSVDLGGPGWDLVLLGGDAVIVTQDEATPNQVVVWSAKDLHRLSHGGLTTRFYELFATDDHVLVGSANELDVLAATGETTARVGFTSPTSASIAADKVAVAGAGGHVVLYEWPTLKEVRSWSTGVLVATVRFRPDGEILASLGDRHARLWDARSGSMLADVELPALLTQLAWSPDGSHLAIGGASGVVWVWDLTPPKQAELGAYLACASPWHREDTVLVATPFDPASCAVLTH